MSRHGLYNRRVPEPLTPSRYRLDVDAVLSGRDRTARATVLRTLTRCAEPIYAMTMSARNAAFRHGWRKAVTLPRPVISVGNITTGGTGKTPMVIYLARHLMARDLKPAILLRGYAADRTGFSDEARLLREALGSDVPIGVGADRVAAAESLLQEHSDTDVLLLDDAFQHRRVMRDLDLVLIDATNPFGYGHVLPRGLLREPVGGLGRADAVIVTRAEQLSGIHAADELEQQIVKHHGRPPIAWFAHRWASVVDATGRTLATTPDNFAGDRPKVLAFCGIGRPAPFFAEANRWFHVVQTRTFDDHHAYSETDLRALRTAAEQHAATALLTTEKDWTKLSKLNTDEHPLSTNIYRPKLTLDPFRGEAKLLDLLTTRAQR
ncbi:MAG: tetraacyldisaccharide 4'-kinase [Phycisphaeraceae bacterium]